MMRPATIIAVPCVIALSSCSTSTKPYSTEIVVRSACIYNGDGIKIGECKPWLDFTFSELTEKVHRLEINYDYIYKEIGTGEQPAVKCYLQTNESKQIFPARGCPDKTTGNIWTVYENQSGFAAGKYVASFEHVNGSSNTFVRINYKK